MAHPARRTDTAPRAFGSLGSSPHAELHDLPLAAVVGLAVQEASPAHHRSHASQSGWETGASGPSPGALTPDDRARGAARAVRVWEHDVDPAQAVPYASGDRAAPDHNGGDTLGVASGLVCGLRLLDQSPSTYRACYGLRPPVQCVHGRVGWDLWQRPPYGANLLRLGPAGAHQLGGDPESPGPGDPGYRPILCGDCAASAAGLGQLY